MNMKKTIAAIAACATAVSAMATTVSAVSEGATEAQKAKYSLTLKEKTKNASFTAISNKADTDETDDACAIEIVVPTAVTKSFGNEVTLSIQNKTTQKNYEYTFTTDDKSPKYDGVAAKLPVVTVKDNGASANPRYEDKIDTTKEAYVLDFTAANSANGAALLQAIIGDDVDIAVSFSTNTVAVDADGNEQKNVNTAIKEGKVSVKVLDSITRGIKLNGTEIYAPVGTSTANQTIAFVASTEMSKNNAFNIRGTVNTTDVEKPMKTNNNVSSDNVGTAEIFARLDTTNVREYGKKYNNAKAVINDMIANYDEVVFTFNTATKKVHDGQYDSWGTDYTKFPQQLYNLFGDENTGYVYANSPTYTFNNLFNAALVANNGLTMNQNAIAPFVYNATSVSFEWDTMTATGGQFVSAANAIDTLQLATSSEWYWDSMEVVGYKAAVEDTESQAPVEADEEDLDDTDAEIDDTDDADAEIDDTDDADVDDADTDDVDDTDDADADDTTDEGDAAADEGDAAADETTGNPETGNAPIALAVIPVALAAAAVVAKKRG